MSAPARFDTSRWRPDPRAALARFASPASTAALITLSENATYRVDDPEREHPFILRVVPPIRRTRQQVESEITWADAVRSSGAARTPAAIASESGEVVVEVTDDSGAACLAVAIEFVDGENGEERRAPATFRAIGEAAARLHTQAERWTPPAEFDRPLLDQQSEMAVGGREGHWTELHGLDDDTIDVFTRVGERIADRLDEYGTPAGASGLIHADLRLANVLVDRAGGLTLIDFDDCGWGWHMYELACSFSFLEAEPDIEQNILAWLDGYRAGREIAPRELAIVPTMVMLRRMFLTGWMGTHSTTTEAKSMASGYTADSRRLGESYLDGTLYPALSS